MGYIESMKCEPCISNIDGFHIALLDTAVHFPANAGKWRNFLNWVFNDLEEPDRGDSYYSTASIAWLFCLSGEGYEDRCKMVAEFLEKEGRNE